MQRLSGPGGWGALMSCRGRLKEVWGGEAATTNNRLELTAVVEGLRALRRCSVVEVRRTRGMSLTG